MICLDPVSVLDVDIETLARMDSRFESLHATTSSALEPQQQPNISEGHNRVRCKESSGFQVFHFGTAYFSETEGFKDIKKKDIKTFFTIVTNAHTTPTNIFIYLHFLFLHYAHYTIQ